MNPAQATRLAFTAIALGCAAPLPLLAQTAGGATPSAPPSAEQVQMCRALLGRSFGPARVLAATAITPPYAAGDGGFSVPVQHPFCLVEGRIEPEPGSEIGFEVWLPVPSAWNGRFLAVGSGGSMGGFSFQALGRGVNRGFATVSTDSGHRQQRGNDGTWAWQRPQRVLDFGHRARHLSTAAGKAVTAAFYGRAPSYSYFSGYSRGGAEGLMSAQRYPGDYDGILAGAPPTSWAREMAMQAWTLRAFSETPNSALTAAQMDALSDEFTRRCAGPDGLVSDPRQCLARFDLEALRCGIGAGSTCLRPEQITALRKVYRGPHTSAGKRIFRGLMPGSEFAWKPMYDVGSRGIDRSGGSWLGVWRYMVFEDPTWTLGRLDFDRDPAFAERRIGPVLTQDNPDLGTFARRGGRLLVFQPWADEFVPPESVIDYYDAVVARMGRAAADEVMRLFMIPGVDHGLRGPGAGVLQHSERATAVPLTPERDLMTALMQWVEQGRAPDRFVASKLDAQGRVERTRLLCPEPGTVRHRGGDPLDAANWECVPR